jgi:hypothetical protein
MVTASCHCGAVRLEMARTPRKLTQCNCSICRRYGAIWAYYRRKSVRVVCARNALSLYTWRNETLQFYRCKKCGSVTHHEQMRKRSDGTDTLAVNVRNIDNPAAIADLPIKLLDGASSWKVLGEGAQPDLFSSPFTKRRDVSDQSS